MASASAAAADAPAPDAESPKVGLKDKLKEKLFGSKKKKLIALGAVVLVVVLAGAGTALVVMKKRAAAAAADAGLETTAAGQAHEEKEEHADEKKTPPTFVPLDQFTVNLADKEQDRFAQVGLVLELDDPKVAEDIKTYMPSIRNAILLLLSHKTSAELNEPNGKEQLAEDVRVAAAEAMGLKVSPPANIASGPDATPKVKGKAKKGQDDNPIVHVNYSAFIIQ